MIYTSYESLLKGFIGGVFKLSEKKMESEGQNLKSRHDQTQEKMVFGAITPTTKVMN